MGEIDEKERRTVRAHFTVSLSVLDATRDIGSVETLVVAQLSTHCYSFLFSLAMENANLTNIFFPWWKNKMAAVTR